MPNGDTRSRRLAEFLGLVAFALALVLAVAAVVAVLILLRDSRFGLRVRAVGRNPQSAFLLGIPTGRYTVAAFGLCGALAGPAGTAPAPGCHPKLVPALSGVRVPRRPGRAARRISGGLDRSDRSLLCRGAGGEHPAVAPSRYRFVVGRGGPGCAGARSDDRRRRPGVLGGARPGSGRRGGGLRWRSSPGSSPRRHR